MDPNLARRTGSGVLPVHASLAAAGAALVAAHLHWADPVVGTVELAAPTAGTQYVLKKLLISLDIPSTLTLSTAAGTIFGPHVLPAGVFQINFAGAEQRFGDAGQPLISMTGAVTAQIDMYLELAYT